MRYPFHVQWLSPTTVRLFRLPEYKAHPHVPIVVGTLGIKLLRSSYLAALGDFTVVGVEVQHLTSPVWTWSLLNGELGRHLQTNSSAVYTLLAHDIYQTMHRMYVQEFKHEPDSERIKEYMIHDEADPIEGQSTAC